MCIGTAPYNYLEDVVHKKWLHFLCTWLLWFMVRLKGNHVNVLNHLIELLSVRLPEDVFHTRDPAYIYWQVVFPYALLITIF